MFARVIAVILILASAIGGVAAAPFAPRDDNEVIERLPLKPSDPALRDLRAMNAQRKASPFDLDLAIRVARGYFDLGRSSGDPRYVGYAQAALAPWLGAERPPTEVLLLRAAMRQRVHAFEAALADLGVVLADDPRNIQGRLTRAAVLQVTGAFDAARDDCRRLNGFGVELVRRVCLGNVDGSTGKLSESYEELRNALAAAPHAEPPIRIWVLTTLAEMAGRANRPLEAEAHFRAARALDAEDVYLLSAYADFLLDEKRPEEVETLLSGRERVDPLLLRLALAARALNAGTLAPRVAQLRDRFEASRLRGDAVHLREEARFTLALLDDPATALKRAQENWRVQKEPADLRILVEVALAAKDRATLNAARDWLRDNRLQDFRIERLLSAAAQPD